MLTVKQLLPSVTDVNQLLKQGDYVGYQVGSFVKELLLKLGFDPGKLKPLNTADEYADALAKGSSNGGVAAIFDEIPYVKVFLSQYCGNNYVMTGPTYKTDGFSFVFPRGSPLLQDLSRAVLSVTEGDEMTLIEQKWLGDSNTCTRSSTSLSSSSLNLRSFAGLFIITGIVSSLMLLLYIGLFLYKERANMREKMRTGETRDKTPWAIICAWFWHYYKVEENSQTSTEDLQGGGQEAGSGPAGSSSPTNSSDSHQGGQMPPSTSNRGTTDKILEVI